MKEESVSEFEIAALPAEVLSRVSGLSVKVDGNRVRIEGRTTTFYFKQITQEAVRKLHPKLEIENKIQVC